MAGQEDGEIAPGQDGSLAEQVYTLVGFWLEAMIYGGYAILFAVSVSVALKQRKRGRTFSWIFFLSTISMFLMITIYTFTNLYRGIRAYALLTVPPKPIGYYHDYGQWDNFAFIVIVTILVWHADALMIYRCFIVWNRNWWITIFPGALLLLSFIINTVNMVWFKDPATVPYSIVSTFFRMVYPVNIAQNLFTTGAIAYRIWSQHVRARSSGILKISTGLNLMTVIRIIIESALIFTVQQLILLILLELNHPAQVILHATLVPSLGLIFVLMTLRTHFAKTESEAQWTGGIQSTQKSGTFAGRAPAGSVTVVTTRSVMEDHQMDNLRLDHKAERAESDIERESMEEDVKRRGIGMRQ